MKVLVYPHDLGIGGSQLNAIEVAAESQRLGHEMIIFGRPGPLVAHANALGLEFVPAPDLRRRPAAAAIRALYSLAQNRGIDVLHGHEWPPALECYLATRRLRSAVAVSTVMSMSVAPFIPKHLPIAVGTQLIAETELARGRARVSLMEPPVDTEANRPGLDLRLEEFRRSWGLERDTYIVTIVSRLAHQLKLEGILTAMEAVASLTPHLDLSLIIAGDGPAREEVKARAAELNARTGSRTIILTGELSDPRPAYDVADVCLGMGGSALRAMSFAKPLVVQGERGFWSLLTPSSLPTFLRQGWYGVGNDPGAGAAELARLLQELLPAERLRQELGAFGLGIVRERFSLHRAAKAQVAIYAEALAAPTRPGNQFLDDVLATGHFLNHETRRLISRFGGREASDDFNARPLTSPQTTEHSTPEH